MDSCESRIFLTVLHTTHKKGSEVGLDVDVLLQAASTTLPCIRVLTEQGLKPLKGRPAVACAHSNTRVKLQVKYCGVHFTFTPSPFLVIFLCCLCHALAIMTWPLGGGQAVAQRQQYGCLTCHASKLLQQHTLCQAAVHQQESSSTRCLKL
jgi:hypothetical protein